MRQILANSELFVLGLIVIAAVWLSGGLNTDINPQFTVDPNSVTSSTIITPTIDPKAVPANSIQLQSFQVALSGGAGLHGSFIARTPADVAFAASHGMSYIIQYQFAQHNDAQDSLDPSSDLFKAFQNYHIKVIYDLHHFLDSCPQDMTSLAASIQTEIQTNNRYKSPVLGGYWIKDDDVCAVENPDSSCKILCDMKTAIKTVHDTIKNLDTDPSHIVMAGYGELSSLQQNYEPGLADVIAFYPYPYYDGNIISDQSSDGYIPAMMNYFTNFPGQTQTPPFVFVYQAFGVDFSRPWPSDKCVQDANRHDGSIVWNNPTGIDVQKILNTVLPYKPSGIIAFSVAVPCDVNLAADNDTNLANVVTQANNWLIQNVSIFSKISNTTGVNVTQPQTVNPLGPHPL